MSQQNSQSVYDLIITNINVMTMDPEVAGNYGLIEKGAVAINNGQIVWVGKENDVPDWEFENGLDGGNNYISPGLIDCHTHLVFAGSRAHEFEQRLSGVSYEEIARQGGGILSTVKATREASFDELFELASKRVEQLISEGVTLIEIKSGYGLDTETELKMLRVAKKLGETFPIEVSKTFLAAHALPPEYKGKADEYVDLIINEMLPLAHQEGLIDCVDGFCEGIGFSREQMQRIFEKAKSLNLPVKLHAEQLSDLDGAALVAEYEGWSADHLEFLSESSVEKMAEHGTVAVLLPGAFYTLSETKLPPIDALRERQVDIAIGSDYNPGSSPLCSLKLMLHMSCTLFRMTPEEAIAGVTRNAAKALGQSQKGMLKAGFDADMCIWDINHPAELAYTFGVNPVVMTFNAKELR